MVTVEGARPLTDTLKLTSAVVSGLLAACLVKFDEPAAAPASLTIPPAVPIPRTTTIPAHAAHPAFRRNLIGPSPVEITRHPSRAE
jgi:hypothetical protein